MPADRGKRPKARTKTKTLEQEIGFDPTARGRLQSRAKREAAAYLALYVRTRNGVFFWKAYAEYRNAELRVPAAMMQKLDQIGERLTSAKGQRAIVQAVEMTSAGGGAQAATRAAKTLRTREIVAAVHELLRPPALVKPNVAYARAAKRFDKTSAQVEDMYRRWIKGSKPVPASPLQLWS